MKLEKIICPICGSNSLIELNDKIVCNSCDYLFEKTQNLDEEEIKLVSALYDAESFIRMSPPRFDFAEEKYKIIVSDNPTNPEAYWGLFKASNDIKYIDGKPICFTYKDRNMGVSI